MAKTKCYRKRLRDAHSRVEALFNRGQSGWGPRDNVFDYDPLIEAFVAGRVRIEAVERISATAVLAGVRAAYVPTRQEGAIHFAMKHAARAWMVECGAADATVEGRDVLGRSDACSLSKRWVIDCGCSLIGKLAGAIQQDEPTRFDLMPFQATDWGSLDVRHRPLVIRFGWDADLAEEFKQPPFGRTRRSVRPLALAQEA